MAPTLEPPQAAGQWATSDASAALGGGVEVSSSMASAARSAVCRAHGVVVVKPIVNSATPTPTATHHAAWVAAANPADAWAIPVLPASAPNTATPSVEPPWRAVEATAAATPAIEGGMPDTAVFVIGGLNRPMPSPIST